MAEIEMIQYRWVDADGVILAEQATQQGRRINYAEVSPPPVLDAPGVEVQYRYPPSARWRPLEVGRERQSSGD